MKRLLIFIIIIISSCSSYTLDPLIVKNKIKKGNNYTIIDTNNNKIKVSKKDFKVIKIDSIYFNPVKNETNNNRKNKEVK